MINIKNLRSILSIFCLFLIFMTDVSANESYIYTYKGNTVSGNKAGSTNTAIIEIEDQNGNKYNTYCMDYSNKVVLEHNYSIVNVDDADFIDQKKTEILRNVIIHSYPFITIEEVMAISNIDEIEPKSAIAATQAIIWYYVNGYKFNLDDKAEELYNFYASLDVSTTVPTDIQKLNITHQTYYENGERNIYITVTNDNVFDIEYTIDEDLILEEVEGGIVVKNVPDNLVFSVTATGNQKINKDVYYYYPDGGRYSSQSLIGVTSGIVSVSNSIEVKYEEKSYNINIIKKDSVTGNLLENTEFIISNYQDFNEVIAEGITDEKGELTFQNIPSGTWYIKEIKTPDGYIGSEVIKLEIIDSDIDLEVMNDPVGSLKIKKIDSGNNEILPDAVVGIYYDNCTDLYQEVKTTKQELLIENIPVGKYCIKEIEAPSGYILNIDSYDIEIFQNETSELSFYNHRIYKTALNENHTTNLITTLLVLVFTILMWCYWYKKCLSKS